jgi:hypothetical protein
VGQLAWIAEKFKEWTDSRDRPEDAVDRDQMLTNVMLHWLTGTAGSSAHIYYERAHADYWGTPPEPSTTTTALAVFSHDNFIPLRHVAERTKAGSTGTIHHLVVLLGHSDMTSEIVLALVDQVTRSAAFRTLPGRRLGPYARTRLQAGEHVPLPPSEHLDGGPVPGPLGVVE